ncbi:MAG: hypothetical protein NTV54_06740 [Ignavibacteriales bacterium]|nr:hypothetical protein [Ignavibacteriales bacterium]
MLAILIAYSRLPSVRTAAIIYFLAAGVLTQVPLFNYLGYEFSAAMTLPAAFIGGFLAIELFRLHRRFELSRKIWMSGFFSYVVVNAALLLIPMAVMMVNAFAVKNCSMVRGIVYYLLLPYGTMLFCVPLAVLIATLTRHARVLYSLAVLAILSQILAVTYVQPQLFAFNPILGYFPGITYDETLADLTPLMLYREFTTVASLLLSVVFIFVVTQFRPERSLLNNFRSLQFSQRDRIVGIAASVFMILLLIGHDQRSALGIEHSSADVQRRLGGVALTKHFVLYYPLGALTARELAMKKAEAEFHYQVVASRLHERIGENEKITVYVYPDQATKRLLIGSANTEITKPWRREIHILLGSFDDVFRHELVHVMAANFGVPVIKASLWMGLNEGVAGAVDWTGDEISLHQYAAALDRDSLLYDVESLFSYTGFALQSSSYAYTVVGSFTRYLIDRYGLSHVKALFRSGDFQSEYGSSLPALIVDWKKFLSTIDISDVTPEAVRVRYLQTPIFRKTCARVVAAQNAVAARAFRSKDYASAEKEFEWSYNDAPSSGALRGLFQAQLHQGKYADIADRFHRLGNNSSLTIQPSILLAAGDAAWLSGEIETALHLHRSLLAMNYHSAYNEAAALRLMIIPLSNSGRAFGTLLYGSLSDSAKDAWIRTLSVDRKYRPAALYLHALYASVDSSADKAADAWQKTFAGLDEKTLRLAATLHAADALYRNGDFEKSKALFWEANNYTESPLRRELLQEWIERCDFIAEAMR